MKLFDEIKMLKRLSNTKIDKKSSKYETFQQHFNTYLINKNTLMTSRN